MADLSKKVMSGLAVTFLTLVSHSPALAVEAGKSIYSKLDINKGCWPGKKYEEGQGAEWWCPGIQGIDVLVAEGDLRYFLGYGPDAKKQKSFSQTLSPFNYIGKTLEWRVRTTIEGNKPYATILRYFTDSNGKKGQILVVTKVSDTDACHVAYVDALTNKNANELAHQAADFIAPNFNCNRNVAVIYGK